MWETCGEARRPAGQDPDVVGLGTFIAYAGSTAVAIAGLVIQYLLFHTSPGEGQPRANPIDALLLGIFRGALRPFGIKFGWLDTPRQEGKWRSALDRCIVAVGDIQLAMGFAALAYAYVTSLLEVMSVYHWWLTVGLVWFSVATNLATASYLRTYFVSSGERGWRTVLLFLLILALGVSMVPIVQVKEAFARHPDDVQKVLSTNVLCYFPGYGPKLGPRPISAGMLLAIVFGILVTASGLLKLYEMPGSIVFKWREHYRGEMQQSLLGDMITCIRCEQRYMLLVVRPILALWLVLRIYADLLNAIVTEIFCIMAVFAWVLVRFIDIRNLGPPELSRWTFGQIVALVLFVTPFASLGICLWKIRLSIPSFNLRSRLRYFKWPGRSVKKASELPVESADQSDRPVSTIAEASESGAKGLGITEDEEAHERNPGNEQHGFLGAYKVAHDVFPSTWFVIALPLAALPSLLHLVLLSVLPNVLGRPTPTNLLWKTIFWFVVYQPLLLFMFLLSGMIVEERVSRKVRLISTYGTLAVLTVGLSAAAILDTLFGLGGIPMSYIGMGTLGLGLLLYILYGLVARPSPLAKGKGRRLLREGDIEEGAPLLGPRRNTSDIRIPVRKPKRWHGPSRRPSQVKKRGYGTIDDSSGSTAHL